MIFVIKAILFLSLFSLTFSSPSNPKYTVHEKRNSIPHVYYQKLHTRSHVEATIPTRVAIAQKSLHRGYEFLMDVSHPNSKNFGQHWTSQKVHEMFSPSQESVNVVKEWLVSSGIDASNIQNAGGDNFRNECIPYLNKFLKNILMIRISFNY